MSATSTEDHFRIHIEPAKLLSKAQEIAVLREAYGRQPHSAGLRTKLANALFIENDFDTVIALLEDVAPRFSGETPPQPALGIAEHMVLVQAYLARETTTDTHHAIVLIDQWLATVPADRIHAQLLADRGKASRRLGDIEGAREALERALDLDPANKDACKRLASIDLDTGREGDMLATLDRLAEQGASHSRLHAARVLAHARSGQIEEARAVAAFDAFHYSAMLEVPDGMASLAAFNAALAAELLGHSGLRFDRYGTASEQTWRIDAPVIGAAPMMRMLLDRIARTAERHVATIDAVDHSWVRDRPREGMLQCWCVMADGNGYETWHVHQFGWMSGVYYVQIPPSVSTGDDLAGCIGFGLPEDVTGAEAASRFGTKLVRPQEGMLMLFPSHSYHRTFPHGAAERRICVAFDIWPV